MHTLRGSLLRALILELMVPKNNALNNIHLLESKKEVYVHLYLRRQR